METEDVMDWMLEEAKKNPMEIHHDFDTRFRVWVNQIIPSRIDAIRQCNGDVDYAVRMVRLTITDSNRLVGRVYTEANGHEDEYATHYFSDRVEWVYEEVSAAITSYINEVKQ